MEGVHPLARSRRGLSSSSPAAAAPSGSPASRSPRLPPFRVSAGDPPLRGWLAALLTTLDGSELGAIQLFDKQGGDFTIEDEAALVHLAQMTSAAVERLRHYETPS